MTHLELVDLIVFTDPSMDDNDKKRIHGHLESCSFCRSRFISLNSFRSAFTNIPENTVPFQLTEKCIPAELLGDFLGGRLPHHEYDGYSIHIADCDLCFERAAFFTHSTVKMAEGVLHTEGTPLRYIQAVAPQKREIQAEPRPTWGETVRHWLASPVPAYAFSASLLAFLVFWNPVGPTRLIDLNSNQVFTIYDKPKHTGPSFGFSDSGRKAGETEAGLKVIETGDGLLRFKWNSVEGTEEYHFVLHEMRPNGFFEVIAETTETELLVLNISLVEPGKAYRWSVTGAIGEDKIFSATGQFTLTK